MCVRRVAFAVALFCASSLFGNAASAAVVQTLFERNVDGTSGNDLAVVTYGSYPILVDNSLSITQFSAVDISANYNIAGFTYDGSGYQVLFQRNVDGTSGNDLAVVTYPTFDGLIDNTVSITHFSLVDVSANYSVHGFTYDGTAYRVLFERKVDGTSGNDLAIVSYPTLDALIDNSISITQFSAVDINSNFNIAGFDFDGSSYQVLFERNVDSVSGDDLALVTYPTFDDLINNTVSITQFSLIDVSANYSVHGLASTWLQDAGMGGDPGQGGGGSGEGGGGSGEGGGEPGEGGGSVPMGVSEPPSGLLFAAGLLGLTLLGRYRPIAAA